MRGLLVDAQEHLAPDHHPREPLLGRAGGRDGVDDDAAAERRDPVGDLQHLVQLVRDEDDRLALGLERPEHLEELLRLLRGQDRGGLVEDQDVGAAIERLQDLDPLLLTDADPVDACIGVDREAVAVGQLAHAPPGGVVVEQNGVVLRLDPEHDVLGHRHHRDEHEVLMHHPDAVLDRRLGRAELDRVSVEEDLPLVGRVQPVEDVHQRRLACAVLAEQRVHLAVDEVEVHSVVGEHPGESLRDPAQLEERCVGHVGRS